MKYLFIFFFTAGLMWLLSRWWYNGADGVQFSKNDPRLVAAKQEARDTLQTFWQALEARDPQHSDFALKFNLNHGTGAVDNESIWAFEIQRRDGRIFGELANPPVNPAYSMGQKVEIAPAAIDDWTYWDNGVAQGHYVTRVMLEAAAPSVARKQRAALGWQ